MYIEKENVEQKTWRAIRRAATMYEDTMALLSHRASLQRHLSSITSDHDQSTENDDDEDEDDEDEDENDNNDAKQPSNDHPPLLPNEDTTMTDHS